MAIKFKKNYPVLFYIFPTLTIISLLYVYIPQYQTKIAYLIFNKTQVSLFFFCF